MFTFRNFLWIQLAGILALFGMPLWGCAIILGLIGNGLWQAIKNVFDGRELVWQEKK